MTFKGIQTTLTTVLVMLAVYTTLVYTRSYWLEYINYSNLAVYVFAFFTIIFAIQFNHSRLAWLAGFVTVFYYFSLPNSPLVNGFKDHQDWLILYGGSVFLTLACFKDRGILSSHSIYRVAIFLVVGVTVYGWLYAIQQLTELKLASSWLQTLLPYLPVKLPLLLMVLVLILINAWRNQLTLSVLLITFGFWGLQHFYQLSLPDSVVVLILLSFYLVAVIISSYFLAYRDELTSLPSRRALQQLALSLGRKYTLAMMDIDHFKKFNDTYGHDIGDQVLKLVASKLKEVGSGGKVFRYGGEEFTVVFPRKTVLQAQVELEQLRQTIADYDMAIRQPQRQGKDQRGKAPAKAKIVHVTISIGVASRDSKQNFEQVLKAADEKLYQAKKNGRNNVAV